MYQGLQIFVKLWKLIPKKAISAITNVFMN